MQIEVAGQLGRIVGTVIHVVAIAGLGGSSVAAPIVGDDPVAVLHEKTATGCPNRRWTAASRD